MEKQELLNAISTLTLAVDALKRAEKNEEVTVVTNKLIELVKKL